MRRLLLRLLVVAASSAGLILLPIDVTEHEAKAQLAKAPGWLGIAMEPSKGKPGVLVTHVIRTSPAEKAGLLAGDRIVKLDGASVVAPGDISAPVAAKGAGKSIALDVVRSGAPLVVNVTLAPRPKADDIFRMEMLGQKLTSMPAFKLVAGSGPIAYPALNGHVIVIDLFATWCGPCAQLTPHMIALHSKYAPQGLTVLGISDEDAGDLATWTTKSGVPYTIVSDPTDAAFTAWGAPALPSSLIVDKHGVVREVEVGFEISQVKRTDQLVQALLKEP